MEIFSDNYVGRFTSKYSIKKKFSLNQSIVILFPIRKTIKLHIKDQLLVSQNESFAIISNRKSAYYYFSDCKSSPEGYYTLYLIFLISNNNFF